MGTQNVVPFGNGGGGQQAANNPAGIPLEIHKMAVLILWFLCAVFSNWVVLAIVHDLVDWKPMDDPMFFLPQQEWARILGDWMVSLSFTSLCLLLIFHRHRLLLFRRLLFILALLNSLRSLMILMTRLPSSYSNNTEACRPKIEDRGGWLVLERTMEQAIRLGLQDESKKLLCGDQFFSGHTAMMTVSALSTDYYISGRWHLICYVPKLFALVGIPCLVLSRTHYTCDVLVAYCISASIFVLYHAICETESVDDRRVSLLHKTFLTAKLIHWFERKMPLGRLDNEFEVPLLSRVCQQWRWMKRKEQQQQHQKETSSESTNTTSSAVFFVNAP